MKDVPDLITLNETELEKEIRESKIPLLVEIGADWCGSCHILEPILRRISGRFKARIKCIKMVIDTEEKIAREYGVTELPLLLMFNNGRLVDHIIGMTSEKKLETRLNKAFFKKN